MEIETLLSRAAENLHAGRCFGPPIERGDVTVVPVALVAGGGGGGTGTQPPQPTAGRPADPDEPPAIGTGGGFGTVAWPLGAYVIKDGNVRWVPVVDATRVVLAVIGAVKLVTKLRARSRLAVARHEHHH